MTVEWDMKQTNNFALKEYPRSQLSSVWSRLAATGIAALITTGCASYALAAFMEADWFHDPGPYAPNAWEGYNAGQFVGLVFFTFLTPVAFTLLFITWQQCLQLVSKANSLSQILITAAGLAVFSTLAVLGGLWSTPVMMCLAPERSSGFGCVGVDLWPRFMPPRPDAGTGFQATIGASMLFAAGLLAAAVLMSILMNIYRRATRKELHVLNGDSVHTHLIKKAPALYSRNIVMEWIYFWLYAVCMIVFWIIASYAPNSWEYFTSDRIAAKAMLKVTDDPVSCLNDWKTATCPELGWAVFKTSTIMVSDQLVLKLFPSTVFFYIFLLGLPFVALLLRSFSSTNAFLHRTVSLDDCFYAVPALLWRPFQACFSRFAATRRLSSAVDASLPRKRYLYATVGQLLCLASVLLLVILWSVYWFQSHNYNTTWPDPNDYTFDPLLLSARVSRGFGQVAVLFMSLLMFPSARSSLLPSFLGLSWEAGIKYHRWLGVAFLIGSIGHMLAAYFWYAETGTFPEDIFRIPMHLATSIDNFTVPLMSLIVWVSLISLIGFAIYEPVRRLKFEWFYYFHHLTYCLMIAGVLWHAAASWQYLLPPVALWFFDRMIRAYRSAQACRLVATQAVECGAAGDFTILKCKTNMKFFPGQYVFLNIAELSLFEWHPFTISTYDEQSDQVTLHIKSMGIHTFTGQLYNLIRQQGVVKPTGIDYGSVQINQLGSSMPPKLTISLDGPYGCPIDFSAYDRVILVAGGIGITPVKAIFESFLSAFHHQRRVPSHIHVLWTARDVGMFSLLNTFELPYRPEDRERIKIQLFHSHGAYPDASHWLAPYMFAGRPDLASELSDIPPNCNRTLLFVCGPQSLVDTCEALAAKRVWHFHTETFAL
eukprot:GILK01007429.1.p1 GENE.GILK01007429.1~~GILK01007429.1.p1  ORF type:complete len:879 (-),score=72.87 GILK01007429.1:153-2789(-)